MAGHGSSRHPSLHGGPRAHHTGAGASLRDGREVGNASSLQPGGEQGILAYPETGLTSSIPRQLRGGCLNGEGRDRVPSSRPHPCTSLGAKKLPSMIVLGWMSGNTNENEATAFLREDDRLTLNINGLKNTHKYKIVTIGVSRA